MSKELEELANSKLENKDFENAIRELHKKYGEKVSSYIMGEMIKDIIDVWKKCIEKLIKYASKEEVAKQASESLLERAEFYKKMGY